MEICLLTEIINGHVSCYINLVGLQFSLKNVDWNRNTSLRGLYAVFAGNAWRGEQ